MEHKNRIQKFLYGTAFMDNCAISMTNVIMIQMLTCQGYSPFVIGIIGSITASLQMVLGPFTGKIGDIYGWKLILILSYIFPAIGSIVIGTTSSIILLVITRILNGIFKHSQLSRRAYLTEITPPVEHSTVLGYLNACTNIGLTVGPFVGGQLAQLDPALKLPFLVCGILLFQQVILTIVLLPFSLKNDNYQLEDTTSTDTMNLNDKGDCKSNTGCTNWSLSMFIVFSWQDFSNQADIILFRTTSALSALTFRRNLPILLQEVYHINSYGTIGAIVSFYSALGIIGSTFSGRISNYYSNQRTLMMHMSILMCVSLVIIAWSPWLPLTFVCLVPLGVAKAIARVGAIRLMLMRGESNMRGVINAMEMSVTAMARAISPSIVGVAQEKSSQVSGVMSAVLSIVSALVTVLLLHSN